MSDVGLKNMIAGLQKQLEVEFSTIWGLGYLTESPIEALFITALAALARIRDYPRLGLMRSDSITEDLINKGHKNFDLVAIPQARLLEKRVDFLLIAKSYWIDPIACVREVFDWADSTIQSYKSEASA